MDNSTGDKRIDAVIAALEHLIITIQVNKPHDHSELDRVFAVFKTEIEKADAYFKVYAIPEIDVEDEDPIVDPFANLRKSDIAKLPKYSAISGTSAV